MPDVTNFPPLTDAEFDELIAGTASPIIVYISRKCCKISNLARREVVKVAGPLAGSIAVFEVDADLEKALVRRLDVKAVPILLVFFSGVEVAALLGFYSADALRKRLWNLISTESDA